MVLDSAKQNLAGTYVNAFVNAAHGKDKLMTVGEVWLYKNKEHGMMAAAASRCLVSLWDPDAVNEVDKYQYASEEYIKAGYYMGLGLGMTNCRSETDPIWALLQETVESGSEKERTAAIFSLGFAYANSKHEEVVENMMPIIIDVDQSMQTVAVSCLTLGFVLLGSGDEDMVGAIIASMEERQKLAGMLDSPVATLFSVAIGLLLLGKGNDPDFKLEKIFELLEQITHPIGRYTKNLVTGFAYAGTGDVLQIQKMMAVCGENNKLKDEHAKDDSAAASSTAAAGAGKGGAAAAAATGAAAGGSAASSDAAAESKKDEACRGGAAALLSIAAVAMADDISREMCMRMVEHILQYGNQSLRRTVPLAIGVLYASNAKQSAIDLLAKLSHDADQETAFAAIYALGMVGAGTNHAKIAGLLRQLAAYYAKEPDVLFVVRIAQGLLYLGKGLMTISPVHSDRQLVNPVAMGGLLVLATVMTNAKGLLFTQHMHWLLYYVVPCMSARMLITVDDAGEPVPVSVRVGQAVDTVGQVGNPKSVTGFQTHTTPVLLGAGERVEMATDEYLPMTHVLEGVVLVKKNPDYKAPPEERKKK